MEMSESDTSNAISDSIVQSLTGSILYTSHDDSSDLLRNVSNSVIQKRLGEYLLDYDDRFGALLRVCGGFHIPSSWNEYLYITIWKYFLYASLTYFTFGIVARDIYYLAIEHSGLVLWAVGVLLQCLILIPVLYIAFKRLDQHMTVECAVAVAPTLEMCRIYFVIGMILWVTVFVCNLFNVNAFSSGQGTGEVAVDIFWAVVVSAGFLTLTLFDMWAVFFVVLDAKVSQVQLRSFILDAKNQSLTLDAYREAYEQLIVMNSTSAIILDGIAILSYISIVLVVLLAATSINFAHTNAITILYGVCTLLREALLLLLALPFIADVNELHDELRYVLADKEWRGTGDTPLLDKEEKNNRCLRLWALSVERPLYMKVLGRHIKKTEMRAQLITAVCLFIGSFLSFLTQQVYQNESS